MTEIVKSFSYKNEKEVIPIISVLEGGYNLDALARSVYEHLTAFI
jgi:acetoin utilization deacetylase AcuC-like enzyme